MLEGYTPDLSDNPFTRTQPVPKCGLGATEEGFQFFGVSVGYCISGSSDLNDYTIYHYPGYCYDGSGGVYYAGRYTYFFMDVYEVVDVPSFTVSADQALNPGLSPSPAPTASPSSSVDNVDSGDVNSSLEASGGDIHRYSLLLLSISLVTVLATLLL